MKKEQKEGIFISTVVTIALLIAALLSDWSYGFSAATIDVQGLERSCTQQDREEKGFQKSSKPGEYVSPLSSGFFLKCYFVDISISFKTILIVSLPVFFYGLLRAFGIIRRIFKFEERLLKFIE